MHCFCLFACLLVVVKYFKNAGTLAQPPLHTSVKHAQKTLLHAFISALKKFRLSSRYISPKGCPVGEGDGAEARVVSLVLEARAQPKEPQGIRLLQEVVHLSSRDDVLVGLQLTMARRLHLQKSWLAVQLRQRGNMRLANSVGTSKRAETPQSAHRRNEQPPVFMPLWFPHHKEPGLGPWPALAVVAPHAEQPSAPRRCARHVERDLRRHAENVRARTCVCARVRASM